MYRLSYVLSLYRGFRVLGNLRLICDESRLDERGDAFEGIKLERSLIKGSNLTIPSIQTRYSRRDLFHFFTVPKEIITWPLNTTPASLHTESVSVSVKTELSTPSKNRKRIRLRRKISCLPRKMPTRSVCCLLSRPLQRIIMSRLE